MPRSAVHFRSRVDVVLRSAMVTQFVCPYCEAVFDEERQLLEHFCPMAPEPDASPTS